MSTPRMTEQELTEAHRRIRLSRAGKGRVRRAGPVSAGADSQDAGHVRKVSPVTASPFFLVHGEAMGKPRMTQLDKWKQRPVVLRYRAWCDLVRLSAGLTEHMTLTRPTRLTLRIFLACPASWSRTKRLDYNGDPHTAKPDLDNIAKGIMDALFVNDSYVYKVEMEKWWTEANPHVAVTIEEAQP